MDEVLDLAIRRRDPNGLDQNLVRNIILQDIFQNPVLQEDVQNIADAAEFNINDIEAKYIKPYFRFERNDIPRLARALRIPDVITTRSGFVATGIEGLCILLKRLTYPNRLCDLQSVFKRSSSALSEITNFINDLIYENHRYLLEDLQHLPWLNQERLAFYAQAVTTKGAAVENCWAFIDGTARAVCRPTEEQEEYYSGHKRFHCVKYQSVLCPDGLIVSLLGAYPGRHHDAFIFRESGLYVQLENHTRFENGHYVVYGDQAYGIRELLLCPYPGRGLNEAQQNFNTSMSLVRQAVEWGFQKIVSEFAFLDFKKNQKLRLQNIESMYKTGVILTNCHTCLYSSETAQFFNIDPIDLDVYLQNV